MSDLGLPSYAGEAPFPCGQFEDPQPVHLPFGQSLSARFGSFTYNDAYGHLHLLAIPLKP